MKRFIFMLLSLLIILSCNKNEIDNNTEKPTYIFHPRECNYLWAFNISRIDSTVYGLIYTENKYIHSNQSVNIKDYALEFTTCNVGMDAIVYGDGQNYKEVYDSGHEDILFKTPAYAALWYVGNHLQDATDKVIETKLLAYFEKRDTKTSSTRYAFGDICHIDYRTTPIKDIKISASVEINGIKAGESLNSLFVVDGYAKDHDFIITSTKDLVTDNIDNISIDKYLYYRPMAPAALTFKFRDDVNVNTHTETTFTIELTTIDGKIIKTVTPLVILNPKTK